MLKQKYKIDVIEKQVQHKVYRSYRQFFSIIKKKLDYDNFYEHFNGKPVL